jgi:hypothetical protein
VKVDEFANGLGANKGRISRKYQHRRCIVESLFPTCSQTHHGGITSATLNKLFRECDTGPRGRFFLHTLCNALCTMANHNNGLLQRESFERMDDMHHH